MIKIKSYVFRFLVGFLVVNLLWGVAALLLARPLLPAPWTVYAALPKLCDNVMLEHASASFIRLFEGIFVAVFIGVPIGVSMGCSNRVNKWLGAIVYFSYPVPKLALLPIVMLFAGIGDIAKIIMIALILVFQIIIATRDAVLNIPHEMYEVYKSLGASGMRTFFGITLPAILPEILTTLRIAAGTAFSVLFVTETYGTDRGMGYFIVNAWMTIEYVEMYGGILFLSMMGFFLFLAVDFCETFFCAWKNRERG